MSGTNQIGQAQNLFMGSGVQFSNNRRFMRYHNMFFTIADAATTQLFNGYLVPCLEAYDGHIWGIHNERIGLVAQGLLPAAAHTMKRKLFKHGYDWECINPDGTPNRDCYFFMQHWSKRNELLDKLKTEFIFRCAGGTSLYQLNGVTKDSSLNVYRIDKFIPSLTNLGRLRKVYTHIHSIKDNKDAYWLLTEERFISADKPYRIFKYFKHVDTVNLNMPVAENSQSSYKFDQLPEEIKKFHYENFGSIKVDERELLPFIDNIGAVLVKYNEGIAGLEHIGLGQSMADILLQDSFNYDLSFQFGAIERIVARPRVLIPSGFVNRNNKNGLDSAMNSVFYENYTPTSDSDTKPQQIAFPLRSQEIKLDRETILQNAAMKLGASADLLADWAAKAGGTSGTSATAIIHSDKKTDNLILDHKHNTECAINKLILPMLKANGFENVECRLIVHPENSLDFGTEAQALSTLFKNKMLPPDIIADRICREYPRETRERVAMFMENAQAQEALEVLAKIQAQLVGQQSNEDKGGDNKGNQGKKDDAEADKKTKGDRNLTNTTTGKEN